MVLAVDLHLPMAQSLKDKRALIQPIVTGARQRFGVSAAEVDHQDLHQRAGLAMASVGSSPRHLTDLAEQVERWIWSHGGVEVASCSRHWCEPEL